MRGRKPKPTALRIAEGVPGHRPLPRNEPKPPRVEPDVLKAPRFLDAYGREEWRRRVPELDRLGLLTILDVGTITRYCDIYSMWRRARLALRTGFANEKGGRKAEAQMVKDCWAALVKIEEQFGMTASSRARVEVEPVPPTLVKPTGTEGKKDPSRFFRD